LQECVTVYEKSIATVEKVNQARLEWLRRDKEELIRDIRKNDN
jgi:hypothetical protein